MKNNNREKFYGWRVLVGCVLCMFLMQGLVQTFAVLMPTIVKESGWELSKVALCSTCASTSAFLANLALIPLLKKISARKMLVYGTVLLIICMIIYSISPNVYTMWLGAAIGGVGMAWVTVAPCTILITNWFIKNRSQYVATAVAGSMFGSVVLNPTAALLADRFSWRIAYRINGLACSAITLAAILFLIRETPEEVGQKPYGAGEQKEETAVQVGGVSAKEARSSLCYVLLLIGTFLIGFSTNIENFMPAFWQSRGLSAVNSSLVLSAYALFAAFISIGMSKVNDRLGGRNYVLLTCLMFIGSVLIMCFTGVTESMVLLVLCCIPFAAGSKKACTLTPPLVVAEAFGRAHYSKIIGAFTAMMQLGIASSNFVIGPLAERSYELSFLSMLGVNLVATACIFIALVKKPYRT